MLYLVTSLLRQGNEVKHDPFFNTSAQTPNPGTYAPAFDGNGNVIAYVDMATGVKSATYEYGAFGETLITDGVAAETMPFRFSTKYTDTETNLLYYGLRYYSPGIGRWLSRDPIGEDGGLNVQAFLSNDGINKFDLYGLADGQADFVAKSFINGIPNVGSLNTPLENERLNAFADASRKMDLGNQNPSSDSKDGRYRLYTRVTIWASCCGDDILDVKIVSTDMEGGAEGLVSGTINMTKPDLRTNGTTANVSWRGWGRPHLLVEPRILWVKSRSSRNIWHDVAIVVSCSDGQPEFKSGSIQTSRFPSFRLWKDGAQIASIDQGNLSDLWKSDPRDQDFVAP